MKNTLTFFFIFFLGIEIYAQSKYIPCDSLYRIGVKECKIVKITNQKDAYIIYAKSDIDTYKIVSIKEKKYATPKIQVGDSYNLMIYSYFNKSNIFFQVKYVMVSPDNIVSVDSNNDLYYSTNLRGLYYQQISDLEIIDSLPLQTYTVKRINKIKNVYRLKVSCSDKDFLVFSIADSTETNSCNRIKKGEAISLKLYSYHAGLPINFRYSNVYIPFEGNVSLKVDLRTRNAFYAKNLKGLCLEEEK